MAKKKKEFKAWFPKTSPEGGNSRIMGIDPSLTSTGICLIENRMVAGSLVLGTSLTGPARLRELRDMLDSQLDHSRPVGVVVEGYSYASSFNREALAEWGGVLRVLLYERNIPLLEVAPATLRKFVLTEAGSGKDKTILASFKKWGVEFKTNDECDAHALAQLGACRIDHDTERTMPKTCTARMIEAATTACPIICKSVESGRRPRVR